MKKTKKIMSAVLAGCLAMNMMASVGAVNSNPHSFTIDADGYTTGYADPVSNARIGTNIGYGEGKWNLITNNAYAITGCESWGAATYLYVEARVGSDDTSEISTTRSKSYNTLTLKESLSSDKLKCSSKEGRYLKTKHTVKGYMTLYGTDLLTEHYYGDFEW